VSSTTTAPSKIGTPEQFRWLLGIVKVILGLNLLDAMFTLVWINAGLAREANPLLEKFVLDQPVMFSVVKLSLVALGSLLLWRYRFRPLAVVGIFVAFIVYYLVLLYHIGFLSLVIGTMLYP
jgi:hypothetical protein